MYIMIGVCDSITGIVSICHAYILANHRDVALLIEAGHTYLRSDMFLIIVYIILQSATRTSLFYNTVLTVLRTINISQPFYIINKSAIIKCVVFYPILWVIVMIVDSYLGEQGDSVGEVLFIVSPGWDITVQSSPYLNFDPYYYQKVLQIVFMILFLVIPLVLPVLIAIICAGLQMYSLLKPSTINPPSSKERSMTVTIIMLTMLCLVCNIPFTIFVLVRCVGDALQIWEYSQLPDNGRLYYLFSYILGTLLPFCQALLNPVFLLLRGAALRKFVLETLKRPFVRRNAVHEVHYTTTTSIGSQ